MLGEPLANHVYEVAVAQWIYAARRHLDDVVAVVRSQRATGSHGTDCGHHEVDRDDVDGALGDPGELLQEAPGVGDDDRLGHPETSDPARIGLGQRRLDDGRAHHADRHVSGHLGRSDLTESLGIGVRVRKAQGGGPSHAGLGHPVVHPPGAQLLGLGGQAGSAGGPQFAVGLLAEVPEAFRGPAVGLRFIPDPASRVHFGSPVHINEEGAGVHSLLGGAAPPASGHVAGGDGDQMGGHAQLGQSLDNPDRT